MEPESEPQEPAKGPEVRAAIGEVVTDKTPIVRLTFVNEDGVQAELMTMRFAYEVYKMLEEGFQHVTMVYDQNGDMQFYGTDADDPYWKDHTLDI